MIMSLKNNFGTKFSIGTATEKVWDYEQVEQTQNYSYRLEL